MRIRRASIAAALLALGGAWLLAPPSRATSMKPLNLSDLVRESTHIVSGTVSAVSEGIDLNKIPYTEIQLKVSESIRGETNGKMTFRQFGLQSARPDENGRKFLGLIAGMPRYAVGDHVVLFLGPTSKIGYRTTVGLGQGHFALRGGTLQNDLNNSGLFRNLNIRRSQHRGVNLPQHPQYASHREGNRPGRDGTGRRRHRHFPRSRPPRRDGKLVGRSRPRKSHSRRPGHQHWFVFAFGDRH